MKRPYLTAPDRRLVLRLETLRLIAGGGGNVAPEPTRSSTAQTCTATKFGCCG